MSSSSELIGAARGGRSVVMLSALRTRILLAVLPPRSLLVHQLRVLLRQPAINLTQLRVHGRCLIELRNHGFHLMHQNHESS